MFDGGKTCIEEIEALIVMLSEPMDLKRTMRAVENRCTELLKIHETKTSDLTLLLKRIKDAK